MDKKEIKVRLMKITIGTTTTINGNVVTRWSERKWEIGTFNRKHWGLRAMIDFIYYAETEHKSIEDCI